MKRLITVATITAWYFIILHLPGKEGGFVAGPFPTWNLCAGFANGALWEGAKLLSRNFQGGGVPDQHPCWSDSNEDPRRVVVPAVPDQK